jgi:hypothetical protein
LTLDAGVRRRRAEGVQQPNQFSAGDPPANCLVEWI